MALETLKHFLGIGDRPSTLIETFGRAFRKAQEFAPGRELAKGIGVALALPGIERQQTTTFLQERILQDELLKAYKDARRRRDVDAQKRYKQALEQFKFSDITGRVLQDAPTNRQILASSGELALLATLGYGRVARAVTKPLTRVGKIFKFGKTLGREAAIGGGFFGLIEAQREDATVSDIVRAAEMGAIVGPTVLIGGAAVGKAIQVGARKIGGPLSRMWQRSVAAIEKVAEPSIRGKTQVKRTLSLIGESFIQKTSKTALRVIQFGRKLEARLIDRFAPGKRVEKRIMEITGRPLKEAEKIYRDMRQLTSVSDAEAEGLILKYLDDLKPLRNAVPEAEAWMAQLDFIDRVRLGQKVPGNQTFEGLIAGLKKMAQEIGPKRMRLVGKIRQITNRFNDSLLQQRVDAGLITQELADTLRKTHPNYIPHNVIMAIDERTARGLSQSLNVPRTDIMKAVGSAKNIENPISATIQRTQIATRIMNKNKLLNNLVKVQEEFGTIPGMKKAISGQKVPSGFEKINLFRNGKQEAWIVPGDLGVAIKALDNPVMPGWFRWMTFPQTLLKKGATQYNLSFALPNKARDKQTAYLTAGSFIEDLQKRYGILKNPINITTFTGKEIKQLYKKSGGYGASIFEEGESKILADMERRGITKVMSSANPLKIVNNINTAIETSTRLDVFKQGLRVGLTPRDAAMASRDASIDFAKMGTWMRPANQAIPFLNARIQGFINLPRALIKSPETFARMQLYTAAYPTLLLHQHNRRFESYKNIPQYYKSRYWIIMTGETDAIDSYSGKEILVPQFITIPKGEGQVLVSGPIQHYLEKADGIDPRKTSEMIADVVGSASPMEFQTFNRGNLWLTLAAQLGPAVSIPVGLASGISPYFGTSIVPRGREGAVPELQFRENTPEIIKEVGKILNYPPAKIEFILNSFGGLPTDLQKATDIAYGIVREGKIGGHPVSETPFGAATQIPIARRFLREVKEFQSPEMELRQQQKEEIQMEVTTERLKMKDEAKEIWQIMNKKGTRQEKLNYLNSLGDDLTKELKVELKRLKDTRDSVEVLRKSDPVEVRARYIAQRIREMKEKNFLREDIVAFLDDLEDAKILTSDVKKRIIAINQE